MRIKSSQEAFYVACEMERSAQHFYQRAMVLLKELGRADDPLYDHLAKMYADERRHLSIFQDMYAGLDHSAERMLMLSALAGSLLFEGGLVSAVHEGILESVSAMLSYAIQEEAKAVEAYRSFAEQCPDKDAQVVLLAIADEESRHLQELQQDADAMQTFE